MVAAWSADPNRPEDLRRALAPGIALSSWGRRAPRAPWEKVRGLRRLPWPSIPPQSRRGSASPHPDCRLLGHAMAASPAPQVTPFPRLARRRRAWAHREKRTPAERVARPHSSPWRQSLQLRPIAAFGLKVSLIPRPPLTLRQTAMRKTPPRCARHLRSLVRPIRGAHAGSPCHRDSA